MNIIQVILSFGYSPDSRMCISALRSRRSMPRARQFIQLDKIRSEYGLR